jgi:hypothetical protein
MKIKQTVLKLFTVSVLSLSAVLIIFSANASAVACGTDSDGNPVPTAVVDCTNTNGVWGLLEMVLNIMTAGVGIAAVGGIIYAGILYTTSRAKPEQRKKALITISNVVIGLILYAGMYFFLNYLIPGGIFG